MTRHLLSIDDLYSPEQMDKAHMITQALRAKDMYQKDTDYIVNAEGEVGPISGIRFKMIKAQEVGAQTFLVPAANCAEAAGDGLEALDAARRALSRLRAAGETV